MKTLNRTTVYLIEQKFILNENLSTTFRLVSGEISIYSISHFFDSLWSIYFTYYYLTYFSDNPLKIV